MLAHWQFVLHLAVHTVATHEGAQSPFVNKYEPEIESYWPFQSFVSSPFEPPQLKITKSGESLGKGYLFLAPGPVNESAKNDQQPKLTAPMIMTDDGELVWSGSKDLFAADVKAGVLNGAPIIHYWQRDNVGGEILGPGHFYGSLHILDSTYSEIDMFCPDVGLVEPPSLQTPCLLDMHEAFLLPNGRLIVMAFRMSTADLRPVGGPEDGYVWDCLLFVYDIESREQLFKWSSLEYVPIASTRHPLEPGAGVRDNPFDYYHLNSIQPVGNYYLISSRHTWSVYLISSVGDIVWTLEGENGGDFGELALTAQFHWQHHVRIDVPNDLPYFDPAQDPFTLQMFNNFNNRDDSGTRPSTGLTLHVRPPSIHQVGVARFVHADFDPLELAYSFAEGSYQRLSNGNRLVGYGVVPMAKEFGPQGDTRMTVRWGENFQIRSYRVFRQEWHGHPKTKPDLALKAGRGYVSWNGATDVTEYVVYEGTVEDMLIRTQVVPKSGFETSFTVSALARFVLVEAYEGMEAVRNSSLVIIV